MYKGKNIKEDETVLEVFKTHNNRVEKLIGKEYVLATLWKFNQALALLKGFIKYPMYLLIQLHFQYQQLMAKLVLKKKMIALVQPAAQA